MLVSLILIAIASYCNSVMDTITHHYSISVFNTGNILDYYWYDPKESWKNKYILRDPKNGRVKSSFLGFKFNVHPAFTDAWHFYKSCMIISLTFAVVAYKSNGFMQYDLFNFFLFGFIWNQVFKIFYKKILIK